MLWRSIGAQPATGNKEAAPTETEFEAFKNAEHFMCLIKAEAQKRLAHQAS